MFGKKKTIWNRTEPRLSPKKNILRYVTIYLLVVTVLFVGRANADTKCYFGIPTNLGINSAYLDCSQSISPDGLHLCFASARPGGYGGFDLWVTTRLTVSDPWGTPVNLGPTFNSSSDESTPNISADGLSMYFSSNRPAGYGNNDLWVSTRASVSDPWGAPVNLGPTVNSWYDEIFPSISDDGLQLYFSDWGAIRPGGYGNADIWVTTRTSASDPWGTPVNLGPTVNSSSYDAGPYITHNGLLLYFSSIRLGGYGAEDIWVTKRPTVLDPWSEPVNLGPSVNSSHYDALPCFSPDGLILYFGSMRYGGSGDWDLWQVPLSVLSVADLNKDGIVDFKDFAIFAEDWLNVSDWW